MGLDLGFWDSCVDSGRRAIDLRIVIDLLVFNVKH